MSTEGKKAFLDAIHGGKGFVGMHCATDTFHSQGDEIDPYIEMIGGEFISPRRQQVATARRRRPRLPRRQGVRPSRSRSTTSGTP